MSSYHINRHDESIIGRIVEQVDRLRSLIHLPQRLQIQMPLPWLTLIRAWAIGQFVFTFTMFATW